MEILEHPQHNGIYVLFPDGTKYSVINMGLPPELYDGIDMATWEHMGKFMDKMGGRWEAMELGKNDELTGITVRCQTKEGLLGLLQREHNDLPNPREKAVQQKGR